jgi:hypothetical protein
MWDGKGRESKGAWHERTPIALEDSAKPALQPSPWLLPQQALTRGQMAGPFPSTTSSSMQSLSGMLFCPSWLGCLRSGVCWARSLRA